MCRLILFIEGDDDERLVKHILTSIANETKSFIQYYQYSTKKKSSIKQYINTIINVNNWDYFFLHDNDHHLCLTSCKEFLCDIFPFICISKLIIAIREIESWYLAGLSANLCHNIGLQYIHDTSNVTKEDFSKLFLELNNDDMPNLLEFKLFIIENFDLELAVTRNKSLEYMITCVSPALC